MFIKIGKARINLDNVSNLCWVSDNVITHTYELRIEYLTDTTEERFKFDTPEELEKARKIFDDAIKPLDLKPGA